MVQIWPGTPVSSPIFAWRRQSTQKRAVTRPAARRPGSGQAWRAGGRLHAGHGCARAVDGCWRWAGGRGWAEARRAIWPAGGPRAARMGAGHEDGDRAAGRLRTRARDGVAHIWISRAGDFRISLRASGAAGFSGDLRAVVDGQSARARPTDICSTTFSIRLLWRHLEGRHAALVGSEVARGIRQAR